MSAEEWAALESNPKVHLSSSGSWLDAEAGDGDD